MEKEVYIDSCIWLNLFKKEGDATKGTPFWELAKQFIEQVESNGGTIIVSTIILKELYFTLGEKFDGVKKFLSEANFIKIIKTSNEDYNLARMFEQQHKMLSFYDYLHVAIAKRLKITLITRDSDLMEFAKSHVAVFRPENLLG